MPIAVLLKNSGLGSYGTGVSTSKKGPRNLNTKVCAHSASGMQERGRRGREMEAQGGGKPIPTFTENQDETWKKKSDPSVLGVPTCGPPQVQSGCRSDDMQDPWPRKEFLLQQTSGSLANTDQGLGRSFTVGCRDFPRSPEEPLTN